MVELFFLIFYFFGVIALAFAGAFYFLVFRPRRTHLIARSLDLVLFRVLFPKETSEQLKEKDPKALFIAMEQLFMGFLGMKTSGVSAWLRGRPLAAFEIALPENGKEIQFYAAIPHRFAGSFEKQVYALFPSSRVERTNDYNIFRSEGATALSVLRLKSSPLLPLRTYQETGHGSFEVLAGALEKLKEAGEGAAIQFLVRPAVRARNAEGKRVVGRMRQGASFGKALYEKSILFTGGKDDSSRDKQSVDEETVALVAAKAAKAGFDVNIRLVASAGSQEEADQIVGDLEGAFYQFNHPQGNSILFSRPKRGEQKRLAYFFSFRMFDERSRVYLGSEELATMLHFPATGITSPHLTFLKAKEAEAPSNLPTSGLLLGDNVFRGTSTPVYMKREDRQRHMYIIGQTGTGKTTLMWEMIRQDIEAGEGVCFIDPHGDSAEKILSYIPLERAKDVIYFDPSDTAYPFGLNFLEYDPRMPEQKTFVVNELFSIFQKLYGAIPESMGPMFEQYFRNATLLVMDDPSSGNTLLDVGRVLSDKTFRDLKLSRTSNVVVINFWRQVAEKAGGEAALANIVPYITSKFDTFLANEIMRPIVAQEHSSFSFRTIMDEGKIFIVNLAKGRLGELNAALLGLILVGRLFMASLSRVDIADQEQRRNFYLYIDEFQNVTTKSIATILSEARKYRLNLTIAHQFIGQLEEEIKKAVFGNVGTIAAFRVGAEDAAFLVKQFEPVFTENDLVNIDNYHAYLKLLVGGQTTRSFIIKTKSPAAGDSRAVADIKELSRLTYGRPRAQVEAEILRRHTASEE